MSDELYATACHEAAHAVIQYRAAGFVGGITTIVPNEAAQTLGSVSDCLSDSSNEADLRARVLSCYAGAHADRRLGCFSPDQCQADEDAAAQCLTWIGGGVTQDLRDRSRELVEGHWAEIEAVAAELMQRGTLDDVEVETIADIAAGDCDRSQLEQYRALKGKGSEGDSQQPHVPQWDREELKSCDSYTRIPTILRLWRGGLSRADTLTLLRDFWSICDNVGDYLDDLQELLFPPPAPELMTDEERAALAALPDVVTIYRGASRGVNEDGLCWSLDRATAARFPFYIRYLATDPVLVTALVKKRHIIAIKLCRQESEVLTWSPIVRSVEPLEPPSGWREA